MAYGVPLQNSHAAWWRDFLLAFSALMLATLAFGDLHAPVLAAGHSAVDPANASYAVVSRNPLLVLNNLQAWPVPPHILIGLSVAFLFACNLALLRHLRCAYAGPRRIRH